MITTSSKTIVNSLAVVALTAVLAIGGVLSFRHAFASSGDEIPEKAIEMAREIQFKSNRVKIIDQELAALQEEKLKTTVSAHALDAVLCADYGLIFARVGSGTDVLSGLSKGTCPF